jgi:hypothetical protein
MFCCFSLSCPHAYAITSPARARAGADLYRGSEAHGRGRRAQHGAAHPHEAPLLAARARRRGRHVLGPRACSEGRFVAMHLIGATGSKSIGECGPQCAAKERVDERGAKVYL